MHRNRKSATQISALCLFIVLAVSAIANQAIAFQPKKQTPTLAVRAPDAHTNTDRDLIYRFDSSTELIPVPNEELKPGRIYLHYSSRVGRQVWSYLQADGQFWHAFGPGTTQQINTFDFRLSPEETQKALRKIDPKLAFDVSSMDHKVYLRLESNNTWKLVRTNSVPSIYDSETKLRWEMQWNKYLPVVHTNGDDWVRRADRYAAPDWNQ